MNLHLNRRLEVLAREIAEAKKPRISEGETLMFQLAAHSPQYKTLGDSKSKSKRAAKASNTATREQEQSSYEAKMAGLGAPPSVQKFRVGDRVRLSHDALLLIDHRGCSGVVYECKNRQLYDGCHFVALDGEGEVGRMFSGRYLELIEPAPSPASETETEGWVAHRPGDPMPVGPNVVVHCRTADGKPSTVPPAPADRWNWCADKYAVTAYRVVKP